MYGYILVNIGRQKNSYLLLLEKMEWESLANILVIKNPNWLQRSDTKTGYVNGMYYHMD